MWLTGFDGETFKNIGLFHQFADKILEKDEGRKEFYVYENTITSLYETCKPEILHDNSRSLVFVFQYLRGIIDTIIQRQDIYAAKTNSSGAGEVSCSMPSNRSDNWASGL